MVRWGRWANLWVLSCVQRVGVQGALLFYIHAGWGVLHGEDHLANRGGASIPSLQLIRVEEFLVV